MMAHFKIILRWIYCFWETEDNNRRVSRTYGDGFTGLIDGLLGSLPKCCDAKMWTMNFDLIKSNTKFVKILIKNSMSTVLHPTLILIAAIAAGPSKPVWSTAGPSKAIWSAAGPCIGLQNLFLKKIESTTVWESTTCNSAIESSNTSVIN